MIEIRQEQPGDEDAIRRLNAEAFAQAQEGEIIDALRANCPDLLSLVAVDDDEIVGHILFSPAELQGLRGMGLAPMAVNSERQRAGIGASLVKAGLRELERRGCPFVIVLGHADYYPRFGFTPASRYGIRCKWDVPDEVFMVLLLDASRMDGVSGVAQYRPEFG